MFAVIKVVLGDNPIKQNEENKQGLLQGRIIKPQTIKYATPSGLGGILSPNVKVTQQHPQVLSPYKEDLEIRKNSIGSESSVFNRVLIDKRMHEEEGGEFSTGFGFKY